MSQLLNDLNDDEIRIISSKNSEPEKESPEEQPEASKNPQIRWNIWLIIGAVLLIGALTVFFWWEIKDDPEDKEIIETVSDEKPPLSSNLGKNGGSISSLSVVQDSYVETFDTVVNKIPLSIFIPKNLTPKLEIGYQTLNDSSASFVVQAADIRKDNGQIVGAFVSEGNLLSKGQSKAGFCAIINGKIIIGVADSTPYLEQAIETGGYFFRQFPLVVGGQAIENKLPYSSLRKALAELNGEIVVVMSDKKQTLNEFSQTLVDLGVSNAIYLVGSTAPGFVIDDNGNRKEFGEEVESPAEFTNYIVWS